jgi:hypothetical protein
LYWNTRKASKLARLAYEKMAQHPHPPPCFAKKRPESIENKGIGSAKEQQKTTKRPEDADDK